MFFQAPIETEIIGFRIRWIRGCLWKTMEFCTKEHFAFFVAYCLLVITTVDMVCV